MLDFLRAWLFPSACAACDVAGPALCVACAPSLADALDFEIDGVPAFALGVYDDALRKAIVAMKRGERDPLDAFVELLVARAPVVGTLVPMPTSRRRAAARGFDQSVEIARRLALRRNLSCAHVLEKHGGAQAGLGRGARLAASGRFRVRRGVALPDRATLVDDVVTTGATAADAIATLRAAGVRVRRIVAVARTAG